MDEALFTAKGQEKYVRTLKPGDWVWAAVHPCYGLKGVTEAVAVPVNSDWEVVRERHHVRFELQDLIGGDRDDYTFAALPPCPPFGVFPDKETAEEALRRGMRGYET